MVWANAVNALVGLWFVIAPWVLGFSTRPTETWLSVIGGALLLILAGWATLSQGARSQSWIQYVNALIGIWFVLFTYLFPALALVANVRWMSILGGLIALVLSGWMISVLPQRARAA